MVARHKIGDCNKLWAKLKEFRCRQNNWTTLLGREIWGSEIESHVTINKSNLFKKMPRINFMVARPKIGDCTKL